MNEELKMKQQQEVNEKWDEILGERDELLPKPPHIFKAIREKEFKEKYLKAIEDKFEKKIKNSLEKYKEFRDEFLELKEDYADGKMPREFLKNWVYYLILAFLVILEIPTNYTTIENVLHKPIIALFITIALGTMLVVIAHFHGGFIKQLRFIITTPDLEDKPHVTPRKWKIAYFILSLIVLAGIFYFFYIIRLQYYKDMLGSEIDNDVLIGAKLYTKVLTLMVANGVIYLLGVIFSYLMHDPIPGYKEVYHKMNKELKNINKYYNNLIRELDRINKRYGVKE
jgi:hypothetical protein